MRLWHQALISKLPRAQLLGQHRECAALRGNGWGKKHSTVDYVFTHPFEWLIAYHGIVMDEMQNRGYKIDLNWRNFEYRGLTCERNVYVNSLNVITKYYSHVIYPEHNDAYLQECLDNLRAKGVEIEW